MVAAGYTETATTPDLTAAGATREARKHTPSIDLEVLERGHPVSTSTVPVSPSGCPTPAVPAYAAVDVLDLDVTAVDAGLARPTEVDAVDVGAMAGDDIRTDEAMPDARDIHEEARSFGSELDGDRFLIGESIPAGTTTALAVMKALGFPGSVSSSRADNPVALKQDVVEEALESSDVDAGELSGRPLDAVSAVGDPVIAAASGVAAGALAADREVTLAGGTQMLAVAAVLRQLELDGSLEIAMTSYVADDPSCSIREDAGALDVDVKVTDPGFSDSKADGLRQYAEGEGKEGVGLGGLSMLAAEAGLLPEMRDRAEQVLAELKEEVEA